jgi:hypothetical protein
MDDAASARIVRAACLERVDLKGVLSVRWVIICRMESVKLVE